MSRRRRYRVGVCFVVAAMLVAPSSFADMTKRQCATANADGQASKLDGKLDAARAQLQACSDPKCPAIVRDDCAQRLDELNRLQPTVLFEAKDSSGADVGAVSATVDGRPLTDRLTGMALRVDPGEHTFTFTAEGRPPVTQRFIVREGEKDRRERIVLDTSPSSAAATSGQPGPTSPTEPSSADGRGRTQKTVGLVVGGVGIVGLAAGSVFGLLTFSAANQQKTDCASTSSCSSRPSAISDHSSASTDATVSTVGFIAGGVLLAAGALVFLTAPSGSAPPSTGLAVVPSAGPGGGGLTLRGAF